MNSSKKPKAVAHSHPITKPIKTNHRQSLGRQGEELAADYLGKHDYSVLQRNYRSPYGEIDIVSKQGECFVFVEVKTRRSTSLGPPEISVTRRKSEHMRNAAEYFIQNYPESITDWRIDVISIQIQADDREPVLDHFENVIS